MSGLRPAIAHRIVLLNLTGFDAVFQRVTGFLMLFRRRGAEQIEVFTIAEHLGVFLEDPTLISCPFASVIVSIFCLC